MSTRNDLSIIRGDDVSFTITLVDENSNAVDITGYTFWMTVKKNFKLPDTDSKIQKIVTSHEDAAGGITIISMSNTDTSIDIGDYYYDIQMKDTSNKVKTVLYGEFEVKYDVTKDVD